MGNELTEWRPMSELRHRIDQLFRDLGAGEGIARGWSPTIPLPAAERKQPVEIKPTQKEA